MSPASLTAVLCLAQVVGMLSNATFPALIPTFVTEWSLSSAEAGWIAGAYYAGYVAAVPLLVSFTDRMDARRIYLSSQLLGVLAAGAFALLASGLWSALILRFFDGAALAGTYMVGARILSDRTRGATQTRAIAWYTAHFGIGTSLSVLIAGEANLLGGWPWAFWIGAAGHLAAAVIVLLAIGSRPPAAAGKSSALETLDPRPVIANRAAMAYILGYAAHIWEMFGFRTWIVALLTFALAAAGTTEPFGLNPTRLATLLLLLGLPASVLGNELAVHFGRRRILKIVMTSSGLLACTLGFLTGAPLWLLLLACFVYAVLMMADSAALTAGTVISAAPDRRGATMALHSLLGFGAGMVGPAVSGIALDMAGGREAVSGWAAAFLVLGLGAFAGPLVLATLGRSDDPADRRR